MTSALIEHRYSTRNPVISQTPLERGNKGGGWSGWARQAAPLHGRTKSPIQNHKSKIGAPAPPPKTGKIAIKVINHYGDEVLKVYDTKKV